jgi:cell division protein FtsI/penicillin-binding protein 2
MRNRRSRVAGFFMAKRIQYQRLIWLGLLLSVAFAGLGYRLVDLQVLRHKELSALAQANTQREFLLEPRRGDILDAKGNLLATTLLMKGVYADPIMVGTNQLAVAHLLAPLLQTNENLLVQQLTPALRRLETDGVLTNVYNRHVCLTKRVSVETWSKISWAMTNLVLGPDEKALPRSQRAFNEALRQKAVFAEDEHLRVYPNQRLASHVLGYASSVDRKINNLAVREMQGRDGIERTFDAKLAGVRGWRLTETDRHKHEVVTMREQDVEAHDGDNVVLTIDSVIQHIVEAALAEAMEKHNPISISGIVMRPGTGEVLAMATLPDYDPNFFNRAPMDAMRNRVIADVAEPGSTFKIVVVSGALNDGLVRLPDTFDCENGLFAYGGRKLHDHERYGVLSVEQIITKSSNIGAAKIGLKMGENRLAEYIHQFGFGQNTGIPLPGETPGIVHSVTNWSKVSIAQIPMGQGIAVTRLQMMMAMCAIANNGKLMQPMLVDRLEDSDHTVVAKYSPQRAHQVISESAAREMVRALKTVVSPDGTAPNAALQHYTVAGKTGTAQKVEHGFYVNKFFSSFIGFFPADHPELCISITMDEPKEGHYGGKVAGPVFKEIAEATANYLNIQPEDGDVAPRQEKLAGPVDIQVIKSASARSALNQ